LVAPNLASKYVELFAIDKHYNAKWENFNVEEIAIDLAVVVVLSDPFQEMERGGTPRRPKVWTELHGDPRSCATPQGLDQRSKIEGVVPKMAPRKGSDAGQSKRR